MSDSATSQATFDVHPSVIFKLGADLITDDIQAIAELIKNSYDADARTVIIKIDTTGSHAESPADVGYIDIVDTGTGMTEADIRNGWLKISSSPKRAFKAAGKTTDLRRTPLGDKGLGRLGSQRLGDRITIITTPAGEGKSYSLTMDWREFQAYDSLSEMKVTITSTVATVKRGTRIIISGLHHPDQLTAKRLTEELSRVLSPYRKIENFRLGVTLDGETLELAAEAAAVRRGAVLRYEMDFSGTTLNVRGLIRLGLFRPNAKKHKAEFARVISSDKGEALMRHLTSQPIGQDLRLKASTEPGWWGEVAMTIPLDSADYDFDPLIGPDTDGRRPPANPGSFAGEIDAFNLSAGSIDEVGAFDSVSEARKLLKAFSGIGVYRDGFNVRVDEDWLGLGRRWSSGQSYFGLRPATTMGYLAISAATNPQLVETTDREGFQSTPYFNNLLRLMNNFVDQAARLQEFLGREGAKFRTVALAGADVVEERDFADIAEALQGLLGRAEEWRHPLTEVREALGRHSADAELLVNRLGDRADLSGDELEMLSSLNALSRHARLAQGLVDELGRFVEELAEQRSGAAKLQAEMDVMTEQLSMVYDTISVGLTAEALSHEIANIASRLARRASNINAHIRRTHPDDRQLGRFIEEVSGSVAGLRRQLAHLAPSLRFVRERRETLQLAEVVGEVSAYFKERWTGRHIDLRQEEPEGFSVRMNRGKLIQVLDNLVLNSEYWLGQAIREGQIAEGRIIITVDRPYVRISDNGPGIDPGVRASLFEAFVSRKPRGDGRGLGLYIVRQLLDAEGSTITLLPEENEHGRPYEFEIDLSGVIA